MEELHRVIHANSINDNGRMVTARDANWTVRTAAFVLWAAAAACAVYWGLRLGGTSGSGAVPSVGARQAAPDSASIAKLLGQGSGPAVAAAGPAPSRYQLLGVVADASKHGAALIAVDGRPAKPYRVGAAVDEGVVLQSVAPRRAVLANASNGATAATLEMAQPGAPR
jgi:general secretion pathway protein C